MDLRAASLAAALLAGAGGAAALPAADARLALRSMAAAAPSTWAGDGNAQGSAGVPAWARLHAPALAGPGALQWRWGVDLHPQGADPVRPFVGLGLRAGLRTTLFYERPWPRQAVADSAPLPAPQDEARLGLEFRTGSKDSTWRDVGTLRLQVGLHGRLALRPRRGGATISWHSRF